MWDNITCWKPAHVGEIVLVSCPKFFQIFDPDQGGFRQGLFRPRSAPPAPRVGPRPPWDPSTAALQADSCSQGRGDGTTRPLHTGTHRLPSGVAARSQWGSVIVGGHSWAHTRPPSLTLPRTLGEALTPLSPSLSNRNVVGHWGLEWYMGESLGAGLGTF